MSHDESLHTSRSRSTLQPASTPGKSLSSAPSNGRAYRGGVPPMFDPGRAPLATEHASAGLVAPGGEGGY